MRGLHAAGFVLTLFAAVSGHDASSDTGAPAPPSIVEPIPFAFEHGLVFVDVERVGDEPLCALLDTGASASAIDPRRAHDLPGLGAAQVTGTTGSIEVEMVALDGLRLGAFELPRLRATRRDLGGLLAPRGRSVAMILGSDALAGAALTIDFATRRLVLERPASDAAGVPMALDNRIPVLDARIGGIDLALRIDTGASLFETDDVYVNVPARVWSALRERDPSLAPAAFFEGTGADGTTVDLPVVPVAGARIGPTDLDRVFVIVQPEAGYFADPAAKGFVSNNFLQRLGRVTFDYANGRFRAEPKPEQVAEKVRAENGVPETAPPSPFDRVVLVALDEAFAYAADFSGALFVWPAWKPGDPPLLVHVDDATTDDGSGGARTPCVKLTVERGRSASITVRRGDPSTDVPGAAAVEPAAPVQLHLVAAPETEATRAAAATATAACTALKTPIAPPEVDDARRRVAACLDRLAATEGALHSDAIAAAAWSCAGASDSVSLLHATARAMAMPVRHLSRVLPADHPDLAQARFGLATALFALGELDAARDLGTRAADAFARVLPEDHPDLLGAQQGLALTLRALGDLDGARILEEHVLAQRSRTLPADHPERAVALQNLAGTLMELGDLHRARALFEQAAAVLSRTLPADHPDLATVRRNLGAVLRALGDLRAARTLQEQVLASLSRALPADHPDLAAARSNLAATLAALGDLHAARALQEEALASLSRSLPEHHAEVQRARQNLAVTLDALGDVAGARELFEEALVFLERALPDDHPEVVVLRQNVATSLFEMGYPGAARVLFEQVVGQLARTLPEDHPSLSRARQNLAGTLAALGEFDAALALFERVLAVHARTLPADHADRTLALGNVAVTLARARAAAGVQVDAGDAAARYAAVVREYVDALAAAARAAWHGGSLREAEERLAASVERLGLALSLVEGMGVFAPDEALRRDAFLACESHRGAAALGARLLHLARAHPRFAAVRELVEDARAEVARAARTAADRAVLEQALARREAAERELLDLAREMAGGDPLADAGDASAIAARLDGAAVVYRRYRRWHVDEEDLSQDEHFCAFVLRRDGSLARVELGAAAEIEEAVEAWRSALGAAPERSMAADARLVPAEVAAGESLCRRVFAPVRPLLGDATRVAFVLDDVLHAVPLDGLPLGDGRRLGDAYALEQRSTLMERLWPERPMPEGRTLLALGAPSFNVAPLPLDAEDEAALADPEVPADATTGTDRGDAEERAFEPLTYTGLEARGIAALFVEVVAEDDAAARAVVLEKRRASRDAVVALAPRARFLHLATHGWFAPESVRSGADVEFVDPVLGVARQSAAERIAFSSPMVLCGLALAGANLPPDDIGREPGLVTAEEIAGWDLSNCELAVLSACDTNVGIVRAGQGVASLQKALHIAGARSVITSLWRVGDESTKDLMLDFYRRMWVEGKSKRQALWEAKARLRDAKDEGGRPRYTTRDWAAWVLTSDSD